MLVCCAQQWFWLLQGALVRRAMQSPPLQALIREIKDINTFLADLTTDTHEASLISAKPRNFVAC